MNTNEAPDRFARQSFLGAGSQERIEGTRIAIIGIGGGGSHVHQQLSHIGFTQISVFDSDYVDITNLNRLVGATLVDAEAKTPKVEVAKRIYEGLHPNGLLQVFPSKWQEKTAALHECDVIVSCLDSFAARRDLEAEARRYLIAVIDIGIDVHPAKAGPPRLVGQVILSMPGCACMKCLGFLSDENLGKEGQNYGSAGGRPQVIWPNGIVASCAVDLVVDLVTNWTAELVAPVYLSYDGNRRTLNPHPRLRFAPEVCPHYPLTDVGAPQFRPL